ncbi:hypothetical protein I302_107971 [Kwoniella bestiolae CBS 10118]|uniref:NADP-dependent oxidoreductase domain-containing protein n=1 Tax=Kwoniella bestiolae CBS 10118 TaxID=1296100 RepID=A0A1B9FX30_9TREE|nr:hypothetical protein I302_07665 [Kwoniella bestiolae CBS 10118]OCF23311.1 hypothetical protein I302_07665 [Kwoniella bestiolae CBS 10118]
MSHTAQRAEGKNRIILGTMTFGPDESKGARITSLDEYKKHLDYLQSQGYNEIDTARVYIGGQQEAWTAQAGYKERGLKIASKWYPNEAGAHKEAKLKEIVNKSLEELKADKTDIYYLHAADRTTPFHETLKAINDLHKEGKFDTFAISNFTAAEVAEVCTICRYEGWVQPTLYQGMYNAVCRGAEPELLPVLRRFKIDWVVYNPIAGGLLSGKYKSADPPKDGRFGSESSTGENYRKRYFRPAAFDALEVIEKAIKPHNLTMVETALRWCVHHSELKLASKGGNDGIIIGVSSFSQLESNLADLEKGPLPDDVVKALDEAWLICKASAVPYWHGENKYTYELTDDLYGKK